MKASNLAVLCEGTGKPAEAESLYLRALDIREKALGPRHQLVVDSLNNLVLFYRGHGKAAEADRLAVRLADISASER